MLTGSATLPVTEVTKTFGSLRRGEFVALGENRDQFHTKDQFHFILYKSDPYFDHVRSGRPPTNACFPFLGAQHVRAPPPPPPQLRAV